MYTFRKLTKEKMFPIKFYNARITLTLKSDNDITRKENCIQILLMGMDVKISNKILVKVINNICRTMNDNTSGLYMVHTKNARLV